MIRKHQPAKDERPFFDVEIKDVLALAQAIAFGYIPPGSMGANIAFIKGWAHENLKDDREMYGVAFKKKEEKPEIKNTKFINVI